MLHALATGRVGRTPGEEPGPGRPSLSPQSSSQSPESSGSWPAAEGKPSREALGGGSQANPDPAGEPREPRGCGSAVGRGGGKPDLLGKERSKERLICPPGSSLAPSARRGGVTAGAPAAPRERGGREEGFLDAAGTRPTSLLHFGVRVSRLRGWREAKSGLRGRRVNRRT